VNKDKILENYIETNGSEILDGLSRSEANSMMWQFHHPQKFGLVLFIIGAATASLLLIYNYFINRYLKKQDKNKVDVQ